MRVSWRLLRSVDLASRHREERVGSSSVVLFAAGVFVATIALLGLGYVAIREWTRGTDLLINQRAAESLALVGAALNRDMKGAWTTLLVPINSRSLDDEPPYQLLQPTARTFARFPYVESLIVWKARGSTGGQVYAFNRADRQPAWASGGEDRESFPVTLVENPPGVVPLVNEIRSRALGDSVIRLDTAVAGVPYQTIAHLFYSTQAPFPLVGIAAITVNINWVRKEYFAPLLSEVARVGGNENSLTLSVTDNQGTLIAQSGPDRSPSGKHVRHFPLLFLDPSLIPKPASGDTVIQWAVQVTPSADSTLGDAVRNARLTFSLLVLAAGACTLGLLMTVRAARASEISAAMQAEFSATVAHELKTPLAIVRLVGDTLAGNRYTSVETIKEYARLLSDEALRLSRTIDRLLVYVKHGSASRTVPFVSTAIRDLVDVALEEFRPVLEAGNFEVAVDIPESLPQVLVDRTAMVHAMEIVIDNAIKYARDTDRALHISAHAASARVTVVFADQGRGIAPEDLPHVTKRFFRGGNSTERGSGLGLAIAARILRSHGGDIRITSHSTGTQVFLDLKAT